jgi:hypothetical protein
MVLAGRTQELVLMPASFQFVLCGAKINLEGTRTPGALWTQMPQPGI